MLKSFNAFRGKKVFKLFTSALLIALAGGAAVFVKQEMDKNKTGTVGNPEILVVDDKEIDEEIIAAEH